MLVVEKINIRDTSVCIRSSSNSSNRSAFYAIALSIFPDDFMWLIALHMYIFNFGMAKCRHFYCERLLITKCWSFEENFFLIFIYLILLLFHKKFDDATARIDLVCHTCAASIIEKNHKRGGFICFLIALADSHSASR